MNKNRTSISFRHSFDCVFMSRNIHYWYSWYFSYSSLQIFIACCYNKTTILKKLLFIFWKLKLITCLTLLMIQSSAYVPLWSHFSFSNLGSFESFKANRYLWPSFSISAVTQSLIIGIHFPNKQSIEALKISNLFCIEKLIKLVSRRTLYGGPRAGL